jgi:hypothetical protein
MNSQNNWYWSAENPKFIHELPPHDERTGWCLVCDKCMQDNWTYLSCR